MVAGPYFSYENVSLLDQQNNTSLRPDFTSKLVHVLAFGTPKFYIAPYNKIKHELVNQSSNCDVKLGLRAMTSLHDISQSTDLGIKSTFKD